MSNCPTCPRIYVSLVPKAANNLNYFNIYLLRFTFYLVKYNLLIKDILRKTHLFFWQDSLFVFIFLENINEKQLVIRMLNSSAKVAIKNNKEVNAAVKEFEGQRLYLRSFVHNSRLNEFINSKLKTWGRHKMVYIYIYGWFIIVILLLNLQKWGQLRSQISKLFSKKNSPIIYFLHLKVQYL